MNAFRAPHVSSANRIRDSATSMSLSWLEPTTATSCLSAYRARIKTLATTANRNYMKYVSNTGRMTSLAVAYTSNRIHMRYASDIDVAQHVESR